MLLGAPVLSLDALLVRFVTPGHTRTHRTSMRSGREAVVPVATELAAAAAQARVLDPGWVVATSVQWAA
jgi:hypothetical protein